VTATNNLIVLRPGWMATGTGGNEQINTTVPGGNGTDPWLWAGPTPGTAEIAGMKWDATVTSPYPVLFGAGNLILVQLVIPNRSYTTVALGITFTHSWTENGQEWLDTVYPYGWATGAPKYSSNDNPGFDLLPLSPNSIQLSDQFEDYLMYYAPGSVQCVPLARFVWSTSGSATIPATNNWATFGAGSAGAITPSGTATKFLPSNSFPIWTQILTASDGHY